MNILPIRAPSLIAPDPTVAVKPDRMGPQGIEVTELKGISLWRLFEDPV